MAKFCEGLKSAAYLLLILLGYQNCDDPNQGTQKSQSSASPDPERFVTISGPDIVEYNPDPQSGVSCTPFVLQLQDSNGHAGTATSDVVVSLNLDVARQTERPASYVSADSHCQNVLLPQQVVIKAGESTATIYAAFFAWTEDQLPNTMNLALTSNAVNFTAFGKVISLGR